MAEVEKVTIKAGAVDPKPPYASKTINFNWISALAVQAILPFLPRSIQDSPHIISAVSAWFALGNIGLRFLGDGAVSLWAHRKELFDDDDEESISVRVETPTIQASATITQTPAAAAPEDATTDQPSVSDPNHSPGALDAR